MSLNINENALPNKLHQEKNCQYCGKEFNAKSTYWKKFCSRACRQNQYVFNKTGRKPLSHAQVDSAVFSLSNNNDEHKIQDESFQGLTTNTQVVSLYNNLVIGAILFSASSFVVRSLLKVIDPVSNALLRANRFLVERGAV